MRDSVAKFLKSHLFIFSFLLILKFFFVRIVIFQDYNFFRGLFLEIGLILAVFGAVELVTKRTKTFFYFFFHTLFSVLCFALILYYSFYGKVVTYEALAQIGQVGEVGESIWELIHPSYFLLFADIVLMLGLRVAKKDPLHHLPIRKRYTAAVTVLMLALAIDKIYASANESSPIVNEIKKAEKMGVLNYQVYAVSEGLNEKEYPAVSKQEVNLVKKRSVLTNPKHFGIAKDKHLIIVQLESFQAFPLGRTFNGQEITPNLNRLMKESLYFPYFFQQVGPGNTSDAEFVVNTSILPTGKESMSQTFSNRDLPSLPKLLKKQGYVTATFHTNKVTFWNRHEMYPALGFDRYYDRKFFGKEDVIAFGSSDEVLYDKTLDVLEEHDRNGEKFYAHIIAMSSHHPFHIPEEKKKIVIPEEMRGETLGNYLEAVNYADYALGKMIERLKQDGLWEKTVLVIYGDHFGLPRGQNKLDLELMKTLLGREYERPDVYNVPLLIHVPGLKGTVDLVGSQVDVLPTLANLYGLSLADRIYFGQDLLNTSENLLMQCFYSPTGTFINQQVFFVPGEGFEDGKAIDLRTHEEVPNIFVYREDFNRALRLAQLSEAYVHNLPKR